MIEYKSLNYAADLITKGPVCSGPFVWFSQALIEATTILIQAPED
jgi:hypothetical protein